MDQTAPRKQRHTAKRIYDRLAAEDGFPGGERIVRQYAHAWKRALQEEGGCFLPLAYASGAEAQCESTAHYPFPFLHLVSRSPYEF